MSKETFAERNLALEAVRATEAAARAAYRFLGRGDEREADQAAVTAMHEALGRLPINGTVRIGEGDENEAPKLYLGEKLGTGDGPEVDVALMPLEGPTIIARGGPNGLSVIAMAENGGFLNAPDVYMDKVAVGCGLPEGVVGIDEEPARNLKELAKARKVEVSDLVACILDRPRQTELIAKTRQAGARIMLIADGDVSGVIATTWPASGIDIYMGIGSAPQGVLAAAALGCVGGQFQGRLVLRGDADRKSAADRGIKDFEKMYDVGEMAWGNLTFAATGVTGGAILNGVRHRHGCPITHSVVMRSKTGTLRHVEAHHRYGRVKSAPSGAKP